MEKSNEEIKEVKKEGFFKQMLSSGSKISSKRVITSGGLSLIVICTISELFFNFSVSDNIFDNLMYLTTGGIIATASEKFVKK